MDIFWSASAERTSSKTKTYVELQNTFTLSKIIDYSENDMTDLLDEMVDCYCNYSAEYIYITRVINDWFQYHISRNDDSHAMWPLVHASLNFISNLVLFRRLKRKKRILTQEAKYELNQMYTAHNSFQVYLFWRLNFGSDTLDLKQIKLLPDSVKTSLMVIIDIGYSINPNMPTNEIVDYFLSFRRNIRYKSDLKLLEQYKKDAFDAWYKTS